MFVPFQQMPSNARVWIYACSESLTDAQSSGIEKDIQLFVEEWLSHKREVNGSGVLLGSRVICLSADETDVDVSGCSIDSSVRFIKSLEEKYGINCFDRSLMVYQDGSDKFQAIDFRKISSAVEAGELNEDTLIFNLQATTAGQIIQPWIPLKDSAYGRFIPVSK